MSNFWSTKLSSTSQIVSDCCDVRRCGEIIFIMGFDDGQILLNSDNGAYFAGQTIYGRMVFDQGKPKNIHGKPFQKYPAFIEALELGLRLVNFFAKFSCYTISNFVCGSINFILFLKQE